MGTDIKGHMRSHSELLVASGYAICLGEFKDLLRILDGVLRLITPTDPNGVRSGTGSHSGSKYYQLTHDYLVPSLREWLSRKQKETRQGRTELRLAELAAFNAKPENRPPAELEGLRKYPPVHGPEVLDKAAEADDAAGGTVSRSSTGAAPAGGGPCRCALNCGSRPATSEMD